MRTKVILLVDLDGDSVGFVLEAAARTGHGVRVAKSASELLNLLRTGVPPVGAVIVDLDPAAPALALLETLSASPLRPPLLVFSGMEEALMKNVTSRSCAVTRLDKPLSIDRLRLALEDAFAHDSEALAQPVELSSHPLARSRLPSACPRAAGTPPSPRPLPRL